MVEQNTIGPVDCACVIHGQVYDWMYVDRLYNMLSRHVSAGIRLHVYTEASRAVPSHMIKHALDDWGISGPKISWWYKIQLFNSAHHAGPLLYFDLDTVIVDNIDWITELPLSFFWSVQDFKYLWKKNYHAVNSSIMWWDTRKFHNVWQNFQDSDLAKTTKTYRGDQDYINKVIDSSQLRFLDSARIKSWRWECLEGGYNFHQKNTQILDKKTIVPPNASVMVFHGQPKPADLQDIMIKHHWR